MHTAFMVPVLIRPHLALVRLQFGQNIDGALFLAIPVENCKNFHVAPRPQIIRFFSLFRLFALKFMSAKAKCDPIKDYSGRKWHTSKLQAPFFPC